MKIGLLWGFTPLCLFALTLVASEQEFQLPIGRNFENRDAEVSLEFLGYAEDAKLARDTFVYRPVDGPLREVVKRRVEKLALTYISLASPADAEHYFEVVVTPGPFAYGDFKFKKTRTGWVLPQDVKDAPLQYGVSASWKLRGITSVSMRLYRGSKEVKYYSTKDGVGGDSPCDIGSAQSVLSMGWASLSGEYSYPWLKESWWDSGAVTLEGFDGFATFDVIDGHLLEASNPKPGFVAQLVKPIVPLRITGVVPKPDGSVEVRVYGDSTPLSTVESSNLDGEWSPVYPAVGGYGLEILSDGTKGVVYRPDPGVSSGFFRVRNVTLQERAKSPPPK